MRACFDGSMRVLVVEDEPKMAGLLRRALAVDGVTAEIASSAEAALERLDHDRFDALVLDVMLPGIDGFELCRIMRARDDWTPTLLLTARGSVDDRVAGFEAGADDYLVKPFALAELLGRLRAITRRPGTAPASPGSALVAGDLRADPAQRRAWRGAVQIDMSLREYALLETFMRHPDLVLTRRQLLDQAWDYEYSGTSNVVDVYVRYLREKIDRPFGRRSIETVKGLGYRLSTRG
jgi:two-component system, OmpR family, response regulator